ncbi:hypothetical protein KDK_30170 [Dictyobacter kobayashii]|uniref:Uncharacterized protein n=1 Tax=Dictyobacter kobayashii TaxID=2014872 RepID=A0A402AJC2_9CHLR|nr:hypothetical protein KDK_30170 [Dictyobacter kobayashii]
MPGGTLSLGYRAAGSAEGGNRPLRAEPTPRPTRCPNTDAAFGHRVKGKAMPGGTISLGYGAAGSAEGGNRPLRAESMQFVIIVDFLCREGKKEQAPILCF